MCRDILTGGGGSVVFGFRFSTTTVTATDRITDFQFGSDKIDLFPSKGSALATPRAFSRAANNSTATTLSALAAAIFPSDAHGLRVGNQALAANAAALVTATNAAIEGTYLLINDGTASLSTTNDLMINIKGFSGTLPALCTIIASSVFVLNRPSTKPVTTTGLTYLSAKYPATTTSSMTSREVALLPSSSLPLSVVALPIPTLSSSSRRLTKHKRHSSFAFRVAD